MAESETQFQWDCIGNPGVVNFLQTALISGRLAHAYLLWGPKGVGKETIGRLFLASILCYSANPHANTTPCGECVHCRQLEKNIHPDVITLERLYDEKAEKSKKNISIEQVRTLQTQLETGTFLGAYKIVFIPEAGALSLEAANSLLKTLEEPNPKIIFILVSENKSALPQTIVSRCQELRLKVSSTQEIEQALFIKGVSRPDAEVAARLSGGLPGVALSLQRDPNYFQKYQKDILELFALCQKDAQSRLMQAELMLSPTSDHQEGVNSLTRLLNEWVGVFRDVLLVQSSGSEKQYVRNVWCLEHIKGLATRFSSAKIISLIQTLEDAKRKLSENVNAKLLCDTIVLKI